MELFTLKEQISDLDSKLQEITQQLDLKSLRSILSKLEGDANSPNFWSNQKSAQKVMRRIGSIKSTIDEIQDITERLSQLNSDLTQVGEGDQELLTIIETDTKALAKEIDQLEIKTFLSGKYDSYDAIISIHAGQGGTEAHDWVAMLLRMYTRYFDKKEWKCTIINEVKGTETGISTISLEVYGDMVYGYLKREHGTHRLVRNSPFNSAGLRQTSFAGVEVVPLVDEDIEIEIKDEDIDFKAVRSSGAGGQNVNKVATSVRIVHKPTGIAVSSSASRSQAANREAAMRQLKSKLVQIAEEKRLSEEAKLKGEHRDFGWGNQIRNYVLQPYKLVKDLRTGIETSDSDSVLDGDIQDFIDAEVKLD